MLRVTCSVRLDAAAALTFGGNEKILFRIQQPLTVLQAVIDQFLIYFFFLLLADSFFLF